jgi:hypothetical protein
MSIRSMCNKIVEIHPRVETRGAAGSASYSWDDKRASGGDMLARIQPARAFDKNLAKQDGYDISHVLFFADDPLLQFHDQVWFNRRRFIVQGIAKNIDELDRLWKVEANELEQRQV